MSLATIKIHKTKLREDALKKLGLLKRSEKLFYQKKLENMDLNFFGSKSTIAGYYPINSELNVLPLLRFLSSVGYKIALPCITQRKILDFRLWDAKKPLLRNKFRIHEPADGELLLPDVVLVPGVLFDRRLNRLGYGGGFYDRTIEYYRKNNNTRFIGICYPSQIVTELPRAEHDQSLDFLINLDEI